MVNFKISFGIVRGTRIVRRDFEQMSWDDYCSRYNIFELLASKKMSTDKFYKGILEKKSRTWKLL